MYSLPLFNHNSKFQNSIFNSCHDLTMLCVNLSSIAIIFNKSVDCCCIIYDSKSESICLLENSVLYGRRYIKFMSKISILTIGSTTIIWTI